MSDDARPLLAFDSPSVGERVKPKGHRFPKVVGPGGRRQEERLSQGVGKVGSGSWLGDELDGAFGASGQGSGG